MNETLDQKRARYVWGRLEDDPPDKDYASLAKGAPALIMTSGLMQMLAFYQQKGNAHRRLLGHITRWLAEEKIVTGSSFAVVMQELSAGSADKYAHATEEALEILRWFRQLASARVREV